MKISDEEINAANYQITRYEEGRGNIQAVKEALEAAYTVRKQRKAAKRERQRKEKNKQVVESVKPHNELRHAQIGRIIMKPKA